MHFVFFGSSQKMYQKKRGAAMKNKMMGAGLMVIREQVWV